MARTERNFTRTLYSITFAMDTARIVDDKAVKTTSQYSYIGTAEQCEKRLSAAAEMAAMSGGFIAWEQRQLIGLNVTENDLLNALLNGTPAKSLTLTYYDTRTYDAKLPDLARRRAEIDGKDGDGNVDG